MPQPNSISGANPNFDVNDNIIKTNDDSLENIIEAGLKKNIEKETSLEKMEIQGGPKAPKPESTMHKVGRFLTGILGGLLLAAGIAAATAATIASCGLAAGVFAGIAATVVAGVGGTAATAVLAGAAGSIGIGLITGSAVMKPRHPDALLPQGKADGNEIIINENKPENSGTKPPNPGTGQIDVLNVKQEVIIPGMGLIENLSHGQELKDVSMNVQARQDETMFAEGDEGKILQELKKLEPGFPDTVKNSYDDGAEVFERFTREQGWISSLREYSIDSYVESVLRKNNVKSAELNKKNVLIMRHAIIQYFNKFPLQTTDARNILNSAEGRRQFSDAIQGLINKAKKPEVRARLHIFRAALTKTDSADFDAHAIQ